jgi:hypothetical protein
VARGVVTLAADTLIAMDHERIGKPKDADDARAMLRRLRQPHDVRTEIAIVGANARRTRFAVRSHVRLHASDREIEDYVASGEPQGKAGGYASRVGLPLCHVYPRCGALASLPASARNLSARCGSRSGARSGGPFIGKAVRCTTAPSTGPGPKKSTDLDQAASRRGSSDASAVSASRKSVVLVGVS